MRKLRITEPVVDKDTKKSLAVGTIIEKEDKRAQKFIDAGVAVEVDAKAPAAPKAAPNAKKEEADAPVENTEANSAEAPQAPSEAAVPKAASKKKNTKKK